MTSDIIAQSRREDRGKIRYATTIRWQSGELGVGFRRRVIKLMQRMQLGALSAGSGR
jgi:hypothetical protein